MAKLTWERSSWPSGNARWVLVHDGRVFVVDQGAGQRWRSRSALIGVNHKALYLSSVDGRDYKSREEAQAVCERAAQEHLLNISADRAREIISCFMETP